jgi:uncharacterized coiled-coil DUF342 family protein
MEDPIVEEVRKLREERSARLNFDLDAIFDELKTLERERGWTVVSLAPKRTPQATAPNALLEKAKHSG